MCASAAAVSVHVARDRSMSRRICPANGSSASLRMPYGLFADYGRPTTLIRAPAEENVEHAGRTRR